MVLLGKLTQLAVSSQMRQRCLGGMFTRAIGFIVAATGAREFPFDSRWSLEPLTDCWGIILNKQLNRGLQVQRRKGQAECLKILCGGDVGWRWRWKQLNLKGRRDFSPLKRCKRNLKASHGCAESTRTKVTWTDRRVIRSSFEIWC